MPTLSSQNVLERGVGGNLCEAYVCVNKLLSLIRLSYAPQLQDQLAATEVELAKCRRQNDSVQVLEGVGLQDWLIYTVRGALARLHNYTPD